MKIGILGGGFGLYGYLPSLISGGHHVLLPTRYLERVRRRDDIRALGAQVEWSADEKAMLQRCVGVVVALPPTEQRRWVEQCLVHENIRYLFLEKPLDVSPALADVLLDKLKESGRDFAVGYHFRYTDWGKALLRGSEGAQRIDWRFRAHHYVRGLDTWKRRPTEGGGALRFYGIHLVALLAELGYEAVAASEILSTRASEAEAWRATMTGEGLPPCRVEVNSDADATEFVVRHGKGGVTRLTDPFQGRTDPQPGVDRRAPFLVDAVREAIASPRRDDSLYRKVNRLWASIEEAADRRRCER
jgi:predicted dehydrogenase